MRFGRGGGVFSHKKCFYYFWCSCKAKLRLNLWASQFKLLKRTLLQISNTKLQNYYQDICICWKVLGQIVYISRGTGQQCKSTTRLVTFVAGRKVFFGDECLYENNLGCWGPQIFWQQTNYAPGCLSTLGNWLTPTDYF